MFHFLNYGTRLGDDFILGIVLWNSCNKRYGIKEYNYNNVVFIFLYAISFVLRIPQTLCCNNMMSEHFPNYKMKNVLILMKQNM